MASKQDASNAFTQEQGVVHMGGIDALVRLTLDQVRTDARRGLKTGMFVSGYRGSPVGMLDAALIKQQKLLLDSSRRNFFPIVQSLTDGIDRVTRKEHNVYLDGQALAEGLFEQAIRNSGVGVEQSLAAFRWGRMAVVDRAFVHAEIAKVAPKLAKPELSAGARAIVDAVGAESETRRLLEVRVPELIAYQDEAYARRYADVVKRVVAAEKRAVPGQSGLAEAAARYLYKLMAYKDEYEVARLHTDPAFLAELDAQFKHGYTVKYNLAPPTISKRDPATGYLIKKQFGPWMLSAFRLLAKFKGLRGGALDIFGKTEERRHERQMIEDYVRLLDEIAPKLSAANHVAAVALASVPDEIRGYGHVKDKSIAEARTLQEQRLQAFGNPQPARLARTGGRRASV